MSEIKHEIINRITWGAFLYRWHYIENINKGFLKSIKKYLNKNKRVLLFFNNEIENKQYYRCQNCNQIILKYKNEHWYFDNCPCCGCGFININKY